MKFFIDTANLNEIKEAQNLGILDGVTTNPSLMAKEGITGKANIIQHYKDICDIVSGDVSAEVISTDFKGIVSEGEELAKIDNKIVVKVPMISEGIKAIKYFSKNSIKTNCTLIFSPGQALLAAKAGATTQDISGCIGQHGNLEHGQKDIEAMKSGDPFRVAGAFEDELKEADGFHVLKTMWCSQSSGFKHQV